MEIMKKMITAVLGFAMAVSGYIPVSAENAGNPAFDEFMMDEFREAMESDYTTMHFTLRDYAAYGIEKPEPSIGSAAWEDYEQAVIDTKESLAKLEAFDYDSLSETQQHDYDVFKFTCERMIELNSYPDYDWWFMPSEGLIDNLPTNFTEFVFYEKQDIDDYLSVLESVSDYIDGALDITAKQVEHGIFMTDGALDSTLDAINKFVARTDDNPLIVIFEENIDAFEGLEESEREAYKARNREILFSSYIPAYQRAAERLEGWRGTRQEGVSIADLPGGKEYYEARTKFKASSDKSPQEILDICTAYLNTEIKKYISLMYSVESDDLLEDTVDVTDPSEIIAFHEKNMSVYPEGPKVRYKASYLDPAVASDGIVAYYLQPPVDMIEDNVVRINGDNVADVNELYSTLAHEGFPGHLYQITWYLNTKPSMMRSALSNIGYTEGWAMYAEDDAWSYSGMNKYAIEFNRINTSLSYAMNAACDIGVNALGWDVEELGAYLEDIGLNSSMAADLYDFVMETPGVIVPYGAGLAQFMTIRNKAKSTLGSQFDQTAFNEVLLTYGDRPFELVEKDVDKWISTFDPSQSVPVEEEEEFPARPLSPWPFVGGIALAVIAVIGGIILIRKSKRRDPFA